MEPAQFRDPDVRDGGENPPEGAWVLCVVTALRMLRASIDTTKYATFHRELGRAELTGGISEFQALCLQAILAMSEDSGFAIDYLDLASVAAMSDHDQAIVAAARAAHDRLQRNAFTAPERRCAAIVQDPRGKEIWSQLLSVLCRLGETTSAVRREVLDHRAA